MTTREPATKAPQRKRVKSVAPVSCGCDLHDAERVGWMRDCLEEIARNAENLAAGGLPHFTRRDFALAVADRARAALKGQYR